MNFCAWCMVHDVKYCIRISKLCSNVMLLGWNNEVVGI